MAKLLVVDNQRTTRYSLSDVLEHEGHVVTSAESADECKRFITKNKYDLVLYNVYLPEMDGLSFLNFLQNKNIDVVTIMTIPNDKKDIDLIVKCVREGTFAFVEKPFDIAQLIIAVKYALQNTDLKKEVTRLHNKVIATIPEIIGESEGIIQIKKVIKRVSNSDARVLITGSNGTGKELVARWLHEMSSRKAGPMIEVNCAAIPNDLIESELFGHEKGSFTSATSQHTGKFELADGGTIFLDEIGDMSLSAQAKVLRVLQENKFSRVGAVKDIHINSRVIAATNKNLKEEIKRGAFREDLYHRLNVIHIHVPSLAERAGDIPLLVNHFIKIMCQRRNEPPKEISHEAMLLLQNMSWTGNIRELQNMVERLVIMCENKITPKDIDANCM